MNGTAAQAKHLQAQARSGGLRFEVYLPPSLAVWLLDLIERDLFADPREAVFAILSEHRDMEPHTDLRAELLRRACQSAIDDPRPLIPHEEVMKRLRTLSATPLPDPAVWRRAEERDP